MRRLGQRTLEFDRPTILSHGAVGGKREGRGSPGRRFSTRPLGTPPSRRAAGKRPRPALQKEAVTLALEKAGLSPQEVDFILAGDLLNQCISSTFGLLDFGIPFLGQYGACSTMAQTLLLASILVESGAAEKALAVTSSHFCSAERQFRLPLEYGGQRAPTAQWTATAAGCALVGLGGKVRVARGLAGAIQDLGVKDPANMGAAMAPAAAASLYQFLQDTGTSPGDYDRHLHRGFGRGGLPAAVPVPGGQPCGRALRPPGLRPAPLRPPAPGRPRRGLGLRLLGLGAVRPPSPPHGARGAAEHPFLRHRGSDVPHLLPAGPGHPRGVPRGAAAGPVKKDLPGGRPFCVYRRPSAHRYSFITVSMWRYSSPGQLPQPLEQLVQLQVCHPAGEQVIGADIQPHGQLEQALSPHVFSRRFSMLAKKLLGKPAALGSLLLGKAQLFSPLGYPLAHLLAKEQVSFTGRPPCLLSDSR